MRTVQAGVVWMTRHLQAAGIENAGQDARILMAHVLGIDRGRLTLVAQDELSEDAYEQAVVFAGLRAKRKPVSHIIGFRDFFGRRFKVGGDVLDPRPETETLIATALQHRFDRVLDLGTGSGAIIVSLLAERDIATGIGTDISQPALEMAQQNAEALGVADRVRFEASNWFAAVDGAFDLIVSNPPYIALDEMPDLAPELGFEPRIALTDESDGLSAYREIAAGAGAHLTERGVVMVEIGWKQGRDVTAIFHEAGFGNVEVEKDLDGRDRVVIAQH